MKPYLYLRGLQALTARIFHTPGMAIGIVRNGRTEFKQGFGTANIETGEPVTAATIFEIASCTKSFTTLLAAQAVQEGRLDWDRPVVDYWPEFELADPYLTRRVTARDMAAHRTGLARHDLAFFDAEFDRAEFISRLKYLRPSCDLRQKLQYQNQVYVALGALLERIYSMSWEELVRKKIAGPLGMQVYFRGETVPPPYSKGHAILKGKAEITPYQTCSADNPCGGLKLSLDGAERWLHSLLDGPFAGLTDELFKPHLFVDDSNLMPGERMLAYGLGWTTLVYQGRKIIRHMGAINGFCASFVLIPEERAGMVILSNSMVPPQVSVMEYIGTDAILGRMKLNYPGLLQAHYARLDAQNKKASEIPTHGMPCPLPHSGLTGNYFDSGYGRARVSENDGKLFFEIRKSWVQLEHSHGTTFRGVVPIYNAPLKAQFITGISGSVDAVDVYTLDQAYPSCRMIRQGEDHHG